MIYPLIFLAALVDSVAGGGGLISLTSYAAIGLPPHMALGNNKFSSVWGTGISAFRFARRGHVQWPSALSAFAGALAGSAIGAHIALLLDERVITYIIVALVPCVAVFMLVKRDFGTVEKTLPQKKTILYSAFVGLVIGMYDGFFGPGAGTFLIMAFTLVLGQKLLTACGNAKVVNFASNLAAVSTFMLNGSINYRIGIPCSLCAIAGGWLGAGLALKKGAKIVRPMMLVIIALLLAKLLYDILL